MTNLIALRKEDKNPWERRVPLVPEDVQNLVAQGQPIAVERFDRRAFADADFAAAGATLGSDVATADLVLGIKEMPISVFRPGGAYVFFSHTIKGQAYNMPMLRALVERGCTLIDYEKVTDDAGRRLIFFGRHAGLAGMLDTLWTLGQRLVALGISNPFSSLLQTLHYADLEAAKAAVARVAEEIAAHGLPSPLAPLTVGITGYGNVSKGAQEILDILPHVEVEPGELAGLGRRSPGLHKQLFKVVFEERHLAEPLDGAAPFDISEYYAHPERYRGRFASYLPHLSVLVNAIYWTPAYPRLAERGELQRLFESEMPSKLLVVGDISCDVDGSLACTVRDSEPGDPVFIYDPATGQGTSGFDGPGLAVMSVGNLPTELPRDASCAFSATLAPFIPALGAVDLRARFEDAALPPEIRRATVLWNGEFTPDFEYMRQYLR